MAEKVKAVIEYNFCYPILNLADTLVSSDFTVRMTLFLVNGHAVATVTRNSRYRTNIKISMIATHTEMVDPPINQ